MQILIGQLTTAVNGGKVPLMLQPQGGVMANYVLDLTKQIPLPGAGLMRHYPVLSMIKILMEIMMFMVSFKEFLLRFTIKALITR